MGDDNNESMESNGGNEISSRCLIDHDYFRREDESGIDLAFDAMMHLDENR